MYKTGKRFAYIMSAVASGDKEVDTTPQVDDIESLQSLLDVVIAEYSAEKDKRISRLL